MKLFRYASYSTALINNVDNAALNLVLDRLPNPLTFELYLRECSKERALSKGKHLHALLVANGLEGHKILPNLLTEMYGKCGSLEDAQVIFKKMAQPNVFSWTILIAAYGQQGCVEEARLIFDSMPEQNVVSWNCMIATYEENGHAMNALGLFHQMQKEYVMPNRITFVSMLSVCARLEAIDEGRRIHQLVSAAGLASNTVVGNALINMYGKCKSMKNAQNVFDELLHKNLISWNALIGTYAQNEYNTEALQYFQKMLLEGLAPNKVTFLASPQACANLGDITIGKVVHALILDRRFYLDTMLGTSLINMYGKSKSIDDAETVFHMLPELTLISWNAMISLYAQNGLGKQALQLFETLQSEGMEVDRVTFVIVFDACANEARLVTGREMHSYTIGTAMDSDLAVGNALINMYSKCGSLGDAQEAFDGMYQHNVISWTAALAAHAQHGQGKTALQIFEEMKLQGVIPNGITFVSILCACSYAGFLYHGCHHFVSMSHCHQIIPITDHQECVVDLLGRAGWLDETADWIKNMPLPSTAISWKILLGACRVQGNLELGEHAAQITFELDSQNSAAYTSLMSMYREVYK